jgi:hypothetical protein
MATSSSAPSTKTVRKVNKLLEITADESMRQALEYLDQAYADASPPRSSKLRGDLDSRVLALHAEFQRQFAAVDAQYREVCAVTDHLAKECGTARSELQAVASSSRDLMAVSEMLQAEYDVIRDREEQVTRFMQQFQLTSDETDVLKEDVGPRFIAVLEKVQQIHAACKSMVLPEQQQAAIEIQEAMYLAQVAGIDKLGRHVTHLIGDIFSAESPEMSAFFVSAVGCLRSHPGPWEKALHEIARVRRTTVVRMFLNACTATHWAHRETSSARNVRGRKPAVDVLRVAGDLCAWLHQAIAEDSDLLSPLFSAMPVDVAVATPVTKVDLLDQIFEGVSRHLTDKIQQALAEAGGTPEVLAERVDLQVLLLLFKLEGLLGFYLGTTETLLGQHASLTESLRNLRLDTLRIFLEALQITMRKLSNVVTVVPTDLSVPPDIQNILRALKSMMEHMQTSFIPHQQREVEFAPVLGAIVDPVMALAESAQLPATLPVDQHTNARDVHRVNTIVAILATILPYDFASLRQNKLAVTMEKVLAVFAERNVAALRTKFGLDARLAELKAADGGTPADSDVVVESVRSTVSAFFAYIYNLEALGVPLLEHLSSLRIRDRLRVDITSGVCDTYAALYDASQVAMGLEKTRELLYHTPSQLRVLLDVQKADDAPAPSVGEHTNSSIDTR